MAHFYLDDTLAAQLSRGDYLLGDTLTAADLLWGTALKWTTNFGIVPKLPVITDYMARVARHPAVARAGELDAALAARLTVAFSAERISLRADRPEVGIRVERDSDRTVLRVLMRFRDYKGKYVMHCHNLIHEDHAMMLRFDIV